MLQVLPGCWSGWHSNADADDNDDADDVFVLSTELSYYTRR